MKEFICKKIVSLKHFPFQLLKSNNFNLWDHLNWYEICSFPEAYSGPSQTSKIEYLKKTINGLKPFTIFVTRFFLEILLGSACASLIVIKMDQKFMKIIFKTCSQKLHASKNWIRSILSKSFDLTFQGQLTEITSSVSCLSSCKSYFTFVSWGFCNYPFKKLTGNFQNALQVTGS